jgi:putative ABC transport system permease protein
MSWRARAASAWRNLFRRSRVERDLDAEMTGYVDMLTDEHVRAGMPNSEARRAALLDTGGVEQVKEQVRDVKMGVFLQTLWQDARYAVRVLIKNPGFSAAAILTLTLGIGATTTIFSVVNGVLFRPLPFPEADRLASVFMRFTPQNSPRGTLSMADYLDVRANARAFETISAYTHNRLDITGAGTPEQVVGVVATPSLFTVLGAHPIIGRTFLPDEDKPGGSRLMILSEALWRRRFNADPAIVGRTITGSGVVYTIVGVMPASFTYPQANTEFWTNLVMQPPTRRGPFMLMTVGRLRPEATIAQAQAEMTALGRRIEQGAPRDYSNLDLPVVPLRDVFVGDSRTALLVMFAAVGVLLLIATVNVANLMLVRASSRGREIAVRLSLGAGRSRLIRQLLTESVLLSLAGAASGVALAYVGLEALRTTHADSIPRIEDVRLDARVLLFTAAVSLATGVLFGLVPAVQGARSNLAQSLRDGARGATAGASRRRMQAALVAAEIALSLMLLIGAGLLLRSFFLLRQVESGIHAPAAEIVAMRVSPDRTRLTRPPDNAYDEAATVRHYERLLERLRQVPGVDSVALTEAVPPLAFTWSDSFVIEGQSDDEAKSNPAVTTPTVSADYFRALGIPVLRGRVFTERDTADSTPVTVISAEMARRYFTGVDPIGRRIKISGTGSPKNPRYEIIGVVGNVKYRGLNADDEPVYYRAFAQAANMRNHLIVRSSAGARITADVRRIIQAQDPAAVVNQVTTLEEAVAESIAGPRFRMLLIGVFAAVALMLAATGIYGVMAYSVAQRTHEMGLRLALGAARGDVLRMVLAQAGRLAAAGIVIGLGGALMLTRWMSTLLFGVEATDPVTFAGVATGLAAIALIASALPARRAMRIDPIVALRQD